MKIDVVIVAYQGDRWIPKCLESIHPSSRHDIRLVLVDNYDTPCLSQTETPGVERIIIKTPRTMGFADANNFALADTTWNSDAVLLLNQDTWSESDWIPACADALERDPHLSAISPTVRQYDSDRLDPNFETCLQEANLSADASTLQHIEKLPAVSIMIRNEVLKRTGPFDPIYGSYYEDYDLCRRIVGKGGRLAFTPDHWVRHFSGSASTTPAAKIRRTIQIIRNRLIYDLRDPNHSRFGRLLKHYCHDFPRNIIRGLLKTESSQPLAATFRANQAILEILWRITSDRRDQAQWEQYLHEIDWNRTGI